MKNIVEQYSRQLASHVLADDEDACLKFFETAVKIFAEAEPVRFSDQDLIRNQAYLGLISQLILGLSYHHHTTCGNENSQLESLRDAVLEREKELQLYGRQQADIEKEAKLLDTIEQHAELRGMLEEAMEEYGPYYEVLSDTVSRIPEKMSQFEELSRQIEKGLSGLRGLLKESLTEHEKKLQVIEDKVFK